MSLQGTLKTLGITEVLEFLSDRSATGRLDVTTEMGTASYGFLDGGVAESDYSFIRESGVDAAEATYYVVSELDGTFYFDDDRAPQTQDDVEDVGSVLARTVDIAEKWTDVEESIPSPNHLLIRNNELDGSVTIQPEWWKALEMIGEGSTSLQLASALELGALDASLTALAMTKAGLLIVREVDPLEIELEAEVDSAPQAVADTAPEVAMAPLQEEPPAVVDDVAVAQAHEVPEPLDVADNEGFSGFSFHEAEEAVADYAPTPERQPVLDTPLDNSGPDSPFQPVDMLEMVDVEPPTPQFAEPAPEAIQEPTMSFADPVPAADVPLEAASFEAVPEQQVETPAVDEFAGSSGMDDLSELEYVLEPDGQGGGFPAVTPIQGNVEVPTPAEPLPHVDDDDGWSNGHDAIAEPLQPMAATAPEALPQETPAPSHFDSVEPSPFEVHEPSPFDTIDSSMDSGAFATPGVPVPDTAGALGFVDLPEPPPPAASTLEQSAAPIPDAPVQPMTADAHESVEAPDSATAMAGEVLDDLASMTDELEEHAAASENWELDGTFVPDENAPPPSVDGDPFGDLGELLNDRSDDERGSVLKFLRRD